MASIVTTSGGLSHEELLTKSLELIADEEHAKLFSQYFEKRLPMMNQHSLDMINCCVVLSYDYILSSPYLRNLLAVQQCGIHWLLLFRHEAFRVSMRSSKEMLDEIFSDLNPLQKEVWNAIRTKL